MSTEPLPETSPEQPAVTAEEAQALTEQIRDCVERAWELIKQAFLSRAWIALGYATWDEYCAAEFDRARIRIPREERTEVVASMREIGMSTRAIAAATGLSVGTAHAAAAGVQNRTPDSVVGFDGKAYQPKPVDRDDTTAPESDAERPDPGGTTPAASSKRRRPITDSFAAARWELLKKAESLARLAADDRFDRHADQLAQRYRSDLLRARDALQAVIDRLPEPSDSIDPPEEG
ncbi:hypothetical protein [Nocardia otitidiscaviarum]|uniref:hypothetical protein n=1 Tax=Nocardia otitidiscaviarum TaxID=1823 RepID=UPI002455F471|nr:hypothetical protein [Nocardia otitidiscaviarum]